MDCEQFFVGFKWLYIEGEVYEEIVRGSDVNGVGKGWRENGYD